MFQIGDELIGIESNPYYYTGKGKRVMVLSVRKTETEPLLVDQYIDNSSDLIVTAIKEPKKQDFQVIREIMIAYLKHGPTKEFFSHYKDWSEPYIVNSKHFKLYTQTKQISTLSTLGPRLVKKGHQNKEGGEENV